MHARGARFLGQACDQLLHFLARYHHQIGKLIDDDDDVRKLLQRLGLGRVESVRILERVTRLFAVGDLVVVAGQIPYSDPGHEPVAAFHLAHAPDQSVRGLSHIGHHGREQMRDILVSRKLEHLRVDQDEPHLARLGLVQNRKNHRIEGDRFPRTGRASDQQVRHFCEISDHRVAGDVLAEGECERRVQLMVSPRAHDLGKAHDLAMRVGNLQAHAGLTRDRLDHADAIDGQRACKVFHQADDLAALHADGGLHLVAGDHGPRVGGEHSDLDSEITEFFLNQARGVFQGLGGQDFDVARGFIQELDRG